MNGPPRIPEWLLAALLPAEDRDDVLGDLHERFQAKHKEVLGEGKSTAAFRAASWYWIQTLRCIPRLAWFRARLQHRTLQNRRTASMDLSPKSSPLAVLTDLRHALRILVREPGFSATAALILALGVGATTTMFSITNAILRDIPLEDCEEVVAVYGSDIENGQRRLGLTGEWFDFLRSEQTVLEGLAGYQEFGTYQVAWSEGQPLRRSGAAISPQTFPLLKVQPVLGRTFMENDAEAGAPPVVLINEEFWQNHLGGGPEILGLVLRVDGVQRTVVGVMPGGFGFPTGQDIWVPLSTEELGEDAEGTLFTVGRLRDGVTMEEAEAQLAGLGRRLVQAHPETSQSVSISVDSFVDSFIDDNGRIMLWIMLLVVSFVLVIAAANVANLLLSRAVVRSKQVAIRMALGGGRSRVVLLLLAESMVLAVLGGVGGVLLSWMGVGWFDRMLGPEVDPWWITFRVDRAALAFTALCVAGATLLAGMVPALQASRVSLQETMRSESAGSTGFRQGRTSRVLVVAQLTLSCALLILSGLMVRGVAHLDSFEPGFEPTGVFTGQVSLRDFDYPTLESRRAFANELERRLRELPGAEDVTLSTVQAGREAGSSFCSLTPEVEADPGSRPAAEYRRVSQGFFDFFRMPLKEGRIFDVSDRDAGERVVVVNEALAQRLRPGGSVVGELLFLGRAPKADAGIRIIGVVEDPGVSVRDGNPAWGLYLPIWEAPLSTIRIALRTPREPNAMAPLVREAVAALDPYLPLEDVSTLDAELDGVHLAERTFGILFAVFGVAALILAVVGLYGVVAFSVNRRARELGVRRALGASPRKILWGTFGDGAWPLALGIGLGIGLGWLLAPLLGEALFGSDPQDPLVFTLVPLLLASAACLGLWIPAKRASRTDPMAVLRTE